MTTIFFFESTYSDHEQDIFVLFRGIGYTDSEANQLEKYYENFCPILHIVKDDLYESDLDLSHQRYEYQRFNLSDGSKRIHKVKKNIKSSKILTKTTKQTKALTSKNTSEKLHSIEVKLNELSFNEGSGSGEQMTKKHIIEAMEGNFSNLRID